MLLTQQSLCIWSTRLLRLKVAILSGRLTVAAIPQYCSFDIFSSNPLGSPNHSPYHSRGRLADAINANNFCHRQVSLCFACKIGGTFSSRVSELCLSACRLHDCETHRTRFVNTIRRGWNLNTTALKLLHLTPSRLRRTPPIIAGGDLLTPSTPITFAIGKCPSVLLAK